MTAAETIHRCVAWHLPSDAPHLREVRCSCGWTTGLVPTCEQAETMWHAHLDEAGEPGTR